MGFSHRYSITWIFIGMPLKDNLTEKINLSEKCYHFGRFKLSEGEEKNLKSSSLTQSHDDDRATRAFEIFVHAL